MGQQGRGVQSASTELNAERTTAWMAVSCET